MKKYAKDMTKAEKQERIKQLSYKFYDVDTMPSSLLVDELQYCKTDEHIQNIIKNLETLEIQSYQLEEEYSATIARELQPLKRIFEYEQTQLDKKQSAERTQYMAKRFSMPNHMQNRHAQEQEKLKQDHLARKEKIEVSARKKLDANKKKLYSTFMQAVRYMYR